MEGDVVRLMGSHVLVEAGQCVRGRIAPDPGIAESDFSIGMASDGRGAAARPGSAMTKRSAMARDRIEVMDVMGIFETMAVLC